MLDVKYEISWNYKGKKGKQIIFHTAVGNIITAMRDWSPAFRKMAGVLREAVTEQYESSGTGGSWQQLSPSTVRRKGHSDILVHTGAMKYSFIAKENPDHVEEITRESMRWGSKLVYSMFHQTGTGKGFQKIRVAMGQGAGRGMAMRRLIELSEDRKKEMRSILVQQLATLSRKEGFAVVGGKQMDPLSARMLGKMLLGL